MPTPKRPDGLRTSTTRRGDEVTTVTHPDGTVVEGRLGPDPRWKMMAPIPVSRTERLPSGLSRTTTMARAVTLTNPNDPFSLAARTESSTVDGRTWSTRFDFATRTERTTSRLGRITETRFDALGRPIELFAPDTLPVELTYDNTGQVPNIEYGPGLHPLHLHVHRRDQHREASSRGRRMRTVLLKGHAAEGVGYAPRPPATSRSRRSRVKRIATMAASRR